MYFLALAADYDGTIASDGSVATATYEALERLKLAGRRLILVTGRRLPSVKRAFPGLALFDRVVAENGALLYNPANDEERVLGPPPSAELVGALQRRGIEPLSIGRTVIATWEPHQKAILDEIQALGLELQIIFNKGAVMVLPAGINKATGLAEALRELEISRNNVVGVGDAENDHAFLRSCGCAAVVANALPALHQMADIRLAGAAGAGIVELAALMADDAAPLLPPQRHDVLLGVDREQRNVYLQPGRGSVLIVGKSGIGKSTLATAITEQIAASGFGFCVFDPEGDYTELEHSVSVGDAKSPPVHQEALDLIRKTAANVVVNTQALALADRPRFFSTLLPRLMTLRGATGRPHWLLVDEAHHLTASARDDIDDYMPKRVRAMVFITVHPEAMSANALRTVDTVVAMGDTAPQVIATFCQVIGVPGPRDVPAPNSDEIVFWDRNAASGPCLVKPIRPKQTRERHKTKYAEGELDPDSSFYFRGPMGKLNLRAQNLNLFTQIASGVDEDTWQFHRGQRHYSTWFKEVIKDQELARDALAIEADTSLDAGRSRAQIIDAVNRRYTGSAKGSRNWRDPQERPAGSRSPQDSG